MRFDGASSPLDTLRESEEAAGKKRLDTGRTSGKMGKPMGIGMKEEGQFGQIFSHKLLPSSLIFKFHSIWPNFK